MQEEEGVDDRGTAAFGAVASTALEKVMGSGRVATEFFSKEAKKAALDITTSAFKKVGVETLRTGSEEAFTEVAQTVVERMAGYKGADLSDPAVRDELAEAAAQGFFGGSLIGGTTSAARQGKAAFDNSRKSKAPPSLGPREDAGDAVESFMVFDPEIGEDGRATGKAVPRRAEIFDPTPDDEGMVAVSIDGSDVVRMPLDTLRMAAVGEDANTPLPLDEEVSREQFDARLNTRLDAWQAEQTDTEKAVPAEARLAAKQTSKAVSSLLREGKTQEARKWVEDRREQLSAAKAKPPTTRPKGWEKADVRGDGTLRNLLVKAQQGVAKAKTVDAVHAALRPLIKTKALAEGVMQDVSTAARKAKKGSQMSAARELANQRIEAGISVNQSARQKFSTDPKIAVLDEAISAITSYEARRGRANAKPGAKVNVAPPESIRTTYDQMVEKNLSGQAQQDVTEYVARARDNTLFQSTTLPQTPAAMEQFVAENADAIAAETARQEATPTTGETNLKEQRREQEFSRIMADPKITQKIQAMHEFAKEKGLREPTRQEQVAIDAADNRQFQEQVPDASRQMDRQAQAKANEEENQLQAAQQRLAAAQSQQSAADTEIDYDSDPDIMAYDAKFTEITDQVENAETIKELRQVAKRLQKEGVITEIEDMVEAIADADRADKMTDGMDALLRVIDDTAYEGRRALEEAADQRAMSQAEQYTDKQRAQDEKTVNAIELQRQRRQAAEQKAAAKAAKQQAARDDLEQKIEERDAEQLSSRQPSQNTDPRLDPKEDYDTWAEMLAEEEAALRAENESQTTVPPIPPAGENFPPARAAAAMAENPADPPWTKADEAVYQLIWDGRGFEFLQKILQHRFDTGQIYEMPDVVRPRTLMHSLANAAVEDIQRNYIAPMEKLFKKYKNVSKNMLGEYLWVRGAEDRNILVAKNTEGRTLDGSGMDTGTAKAKLQEFNASPEIGALRQMARIHDKLQRKVMDQRVEVGVLSKADKAALIKAQPNFATLRGWAFEGDMSMGVIGSDKFHSKRGEEFNTRKKEFYKATGRDTMPENPWNNAITDAVVTLKILEQYKVTNALAVAVKNNPDAFKGLITVSSPYGVKSSVRPSSTKFGEFERIAPETDENTRMVKIEGEEYAMRFSDDTNAQKILRSLDIMAPRDMNEMVRAFAEVNGMIKRKMTTQAIRYLPTSWWRDVADAVATSEVEERRKGSPAFGKKGYHAAVKKNTRLVRNMLSPDARNNFATVFRYVFNKDVSKMTPEQQKEHANLELMINSGGSVGLGGLENASQVQKVNLEKLRSPAARRMIAVVKAGGKMPRALWKLYADNVSGMAHAIDLFVRYGTFKAAQSVQIDTQGAAMLALDSSLDLTKRGALAKTAQIDSFYYFFSPQLNGAHKFITRLLMTRRGQMILARKFGGFGFMLTLYNMFMAPDDEDGKNSFKSISNQTRSTRLIMWYDPSRPDGYIDIPTGFLIGYPMYAGSKMAEALYDTLHGEPPSPSKVTAELVEGIWDTIKQIPATFSPVRSANLGIEAIPSIAKPFWDLGVNNNFFDSPIYNENPRSGTPQSQQGRPGTGAGYEWLAKEVNDVTGSEFVPGISILDNHPEKYRYLVEAYGSSTYAFFRDATAAVMDEIGDVEAPRKNILQKIPLTAPFHGKGSEYNVRSRMYDRTMTNWFDRFIGRSNADMESVADAYRRYREPEEGVPVDDEAWAEFRAENPIASHPDVVDMYETMTYQLRNYSNLRKADMERPENKNRARKAAIDAHYNMKAEESAAMFNRIWDNTKARYEKRQEQR
tara:strand:+ start:89 stop:5464 length:5376 start_codon:yes stop_codon:yes gene_type:complete